MRRGGWLAVLLLVALPVAAQEQRATMVLYQMMETGFEPYSSRLLVTPRHLRMDDGDDDGSYVLFDRRQNIIYSVTHSERNVLEIHLQPVQAEPPMALTRTQSKVATEEPMPAIAGRTPQLHRLSVNGELCYELVAVDGLLPDVVAALRDFRTVLAGENARILTDIPADMQDPCDLALNTYAPGWQLQFGLPIQEHDTQGKGQVLLDFSDDYPVDAGLFRLPKGYRHFTPGR